MKNNYLIVAVFIMLAIFGIVVVNQNNPKTDIVKKVAFISLSEVDNETFKGFKNEMVKLGWKDNVNIKYIVPGPAKEIKNLNAIVSSVVRQNPDMILVSSTPATQAVKKAVKGSSIPVLFCPVNDPVSSNIVKNQSKPEGMITGVRLPSGDTKRFEWLMKIKPSVKTVLIPYTPNDDSSFASRDEIKYTASLLNVSIIQKPLAVNESIENFLETIPSGVDALFLPRDSKIESKILEFSHYAVINKLPLCVPSYQQVEKGALFAFGFIHENLGKEAAGYADKILKGVNPQDLPVKVGNAHLVLNQKIANKIGVEFSTEVLGSAKILLK